MKVRKKRENMAMAVGRVALQLARKSKTISKVLNSKKFQQGARDIRKARATLDKYDIKEMLETNKEDKGKGDWIRKQFFQNLKANELVFYTEQELKNYVMSKDTTSQLIKIIETNEIDLYTVEMSISYDMTNSDILTGFINMGVATQMNIYLQQFISMMEAEIRLKTAMIRQRIQDEQDAYIQYIDTVIDTRKAGDIDGTYCRSCSCSCSCRKGSCSCSCNCSLIHDTQEWEDARQELKDKITEDLTAGTDNLKNYVSYELTDEENALNIMAQFNAFLHLFLFNQNKKIKEKFLFAVIKDVRIEKEKEKSKRWEIKEYLKNNYMNREIKAEQLRKEIIKRFKLRNKTEWEQIITYIKRNWLKIEYNRKKKTYKIGEGKK